MKSWHVLTLAVSILLGCGTIATVLGSKDRFEYLTYPVENKVTRIDRYHSLMEFYDRDLGWVPAHSVRPSN
jgi:hypothetical protein